MDKLNLSEEEWKNRLSSEAYHVLREKGTEKPFTGAYYDCHDAGTYICAAFGQPLFSSEHKYDSGTGWPSFWMPISPDAIELKEDRSLFMTRTEVLCSCCLSHLGHVFSDGPPPSYKRYCLNSVCLKLYSNNFKS
ncbi:MAG: peptide-methionine (R)-S-oxide reductase MsrB [Chlamydiia bacterium]|nr:peptide-methionine (R)-S-oxide reductase MsrB [Chlamydiia bacterium]